MSVAVSWAQRIFRVWRGFPPPKNFGAPSSTSTDAPARRALMAAHSAALPPPITSTSYLRAKSTMPCCQRSLDGNQRRRWTMPPGELLDGDGRARLDGFAIAKDGKRSDDAAGG